jgi:hypothetical protein
LKQKKEKTYETCWECWNSARSIYGCIEIEWLKNPNSKGI